MRRFPALWLLALGLLTLFNPTPLSASNLEIDFTDWTDHRIFDRAADAFHQGDYAWALKAYRELLGRPLEPEFRATVLFNESLILEKRHFLDDAIEGYREIVVSMAGASVERDAWFRLGCVQEMQRKYLEAEATFQEILRRFPVLEPADRRATELQVAWQQLQQGKVRKGLRGLEALTRAWQALPEEEQYAERYYLGKAHIALGMILSDYAAEIDFGRPLPGRGLALWTLDQLRGGQDRWLRRRLLERASRQQAARYEYARAMAQKTPIWNSAAWYLLGRDIEGFYLTLNGAPIPSRLTASQGELYRGMVRERTREYLVSAAHHYLQGHEIAVGFGDDSSWAVLLGEKARQIEKGGIEALGQGAVPRP